MKPNPDNLDCLLQDWNEVPSPSGRLAGPVWQSIEATGGRASWLGKLMMLLHELDLRFARPQAIAAVIFLGTLIGIGVAELRTRSDALRTDSEMSARYLSMLDTTGR